MAFESHPDANLIAAYCEGGLSAHARQQVLRHLADCPACRSVASGASAAYQLVFTPPTTSRPARPVWASLAAACLALAAAGLWLRPSQPAPPRPSTPSPATLIRWSRLTPARTPAPPVPARSRLRRAPAPNLLAVAADSAPLLPAVPAPTAGAEFRPSIDFSPLMTGFLDQPPLRTPRGQLSAELASWTGSAPPPSPNPPASSLAVASPATLATSAAVWPYANGFSTGSAQLPPSGPMAPSIASGLGWAISRGGQVLRSIGAGVWATVPLVPGVHFRALFNSDSTLWAGGLASQLFFSSDRGVHWRQVSLPGLGPHPPALRSISFSDSQHGLVAATDGSSWTTSDAGLSWSKQ